LSNQKHTCRDLPGFLLGDLRIPVPVVQGGMGVGVSLSGLASAVANEGGIGVISAVGIGMRDPDFETDPLGIHMRTLRAEIRAARERTQGVLGVNIMVALSNYPDYIRVSQEEGIDVIFSGAGLPLGLPEALRPGPRPKLVPIVSSGRAAVAICRRWQRHYDLLPDAVVVEGPLAGGHLGFRREQIDDPAFALEAILPEVVQAVQPFAEQAGRAIPVIAAGGVFTGADICRCLSLGAAAVQMGTRFVGTCECDASPAFKQAYLDCRKEDLCIIESPVGLPGRAIRNDFIEEFARLRGQRVRCPYACISSCQRETASYCIAKALMNAMRGDLDHGFAFAGANAYRVQEIVPVRELMQSLREECGNILSGTGSAAIEATSLSR